jgi:hypothetical protein
VESEIGLADRVIGQSTVNPGDRVNMLECPCDLE